MSLSSSFDRGLPQARTSSGFRLRGSLDGARHIAPRGLRRLDRGLTGARCAAGVFPLASAPALGGYHRCEPVCPAASARCARATACAERIVGWACRSRRMGSPPRTAPQQGSRRRTSSLSRPRTQGSIGGRSVGRIDALGTVGRAETWDNSQHDSIRAALDSALGVSMRAPSRDGAGDLDRFNSIALYSQLKLSELFGDENKHDKLGGRRPTVPETAVCSHILQEIASVPSAFHDVLTQVTEVLLGSVYSDQLMSGSVDMCERVPFYEIVDRLQEEKDTWAERQGELSVRLENEEEGRRAEAQGSKALRNRCENLEREVSKWKARHDKQAEHIHWLEKTCANYEESDEYLRELAKGDGPPAEKEDVSAAMQAKIDKVMLQYKRAAVEVEQLRYQLRYMVDRQELLDMTAERDRLAKELNEKTMAHRVLTLKFEKAFADLMSLRRRESQRTPRPDWEAAEELTGKAMDLDVASQSTAAIVPMLCTKIAHLTREIEQKDQSGIELNRIRSILDGTDDDVDLLGELIEGTYGKYTLQTDPDKPTHFIAHGISLRVPRFLRQEGTVRNRKFKKSEIDKMVKTFWTQKVAYDEAKKSSEQDTMAEFVYIHFMKIYGKDQSVVSEWTYSILDGLERFMAEEPHFRLFKHVVLNECAEDAYYDEAEMLSALRIAIQNISDKAVKGPKQFVYTCQPEPLETLLRKFFPAKKTSDFTRIQKMILTLAKEHKDKIRDDVLFGTGRDLGKTEFMKLIRLQYIQEILHLLQSLEDELRLRANPGTDETKATIKALKDAFHHIDRRKDKKEIMAWVETTLRSERNAVPLPPTTGALATVTRLDCGVDT